MKKVYIVRHAKSSWKHENIEDTHRPLSKRGIKDANKLASKIDIDVPGLILSSSAIRAISTAIIFAEKLNYPFSNLKINKSLYSFSDGYLLKTIKALDDSYDSVMIFGHDHGITDFVNKYGSMNIDKIPTTGIVEIDFRNKHWKDIKKGKTVSFNFPKKDKKED
ncbi:MAG: histidine phosphatase family protein [Flavobacteriaceae bacterium]|nr:histidine phosphatase family protein [Flavobacteriaceae bacterium]